MTGGRLFQAGGYTQSKSMVRLQEPPKRAPSRFYVERVTPDRHVMLALTQKKASEIQKPLSGDRRSRTDDPLLAKQML